MFNYYRMKIKGSGGGQHNTFALTMWIGGAGTLFGLAVMALTGTSFKGYVHPIVSVFIVSIFYCYAVKFFAEKFTYLKYLLKYSALLFFAISALLLIYYAFPFQPFFLILFAIYLIYFGGIFYLTRQAIRRRYF